MTAGTEGGGPEFVHSALFYHSQRECVDFVEHFVVEGLARNEAVLIAVPRAELALLRDALCDGGGLPDDLRLADVAEAARNPTRFMAMQGCFVDDHPGRRVRIVSQIAWPGRSEEEMQACVEHEALVNAALEGYPVTGVCLYDAERLDDGMLAEARATHPMLWSCGSLDHSPEYAPEDALRRCNRPLPTNPGAVTYLVGSSADLRPARNFALSYAGWVGLSPDDIEDLQLIATELATNSLMYGGGGCRLAFWRTGEHLVCEARDSGCFDDPLVGRLEPGPQGAASRGLYLINAIADLVRTHTTSRGTTIQAYLRLAPSPLPIS
ncbi:regulator of Sig8 [Mycobacterium parmense]|nr:regulator of Sig8 [Mycobacterium parmense]